MAAFFLVSLALGVAHAAGAQHPLVRLQIDACVEVPDHEVRRFLEIELGAPLSATPSSSDTTVAQISCEAALTKIAIDDPLTGKSLLRSIDLSSSDERARSRLLAIAIYELISASWTELEANPRPTVTPAGPAPSSSAKQAALETERARGNVPARYELDAVGAGRGWFSGAGFLGGGGVRFDARWSRHLGFAADLLGMAGKVSTAIGKVDVQDVSGQVSFVAHQDWSRVALLVGAGLRIGGVHLVGTPTDLTRATGSSGWGVWLGPCGSLGLSIEPVKRLHLGLTGEIGYAALPVYGTVNGSNTVSQSGVWLGFHLALGILL